MKLLEKAKSGVLRKVVLGVATMVHGIAPGMRGCVAGAKRNASH
jgi:hypothetical protein